VQIKNETTPTSAQFSGFFDAEETGPFTMVNLLKFHDRAQYPDGRDPELSGMAAYARYGAEVVKLVAKVGGTPGYAGSVDGHLIGSIEEQWDMIALIEYPSLAAFKQMITSPEYQKISVHRDAGLAGQLNIKTRQLDS